MLKYRECIIENQYTGQKLMYDEAIDDLEKGSLSTPYISNVDEWVNVDDIKLRGDSVVICNKDDDKMDEEII